MVFFLLSHEKLEEAREVLDNAVIEAKKEDSQCMQNSRISRLADIYCYKELYDDVIRLMDEVQQEDDSAYCANHPFNMGLVSYEIQQGNLNKALDFSRQINIPVERYCALDDVLEAYAKNGDVDNYLIVAREFNSREDLCFSAAYSLSNLADFIIKNNQLITVRDLALIKIP